MIIRNQLYKTLLLPVFVIVGLIALSYLPETTVYGDEPLKRVDILSDVKNKTYSVSEAEKLIAQAEEERKQLLANDSIPPGVTPIEDFSTRDSMFMMERFYQKLNEIDQLDRPVRIAYFGDSFVGGDILTGDFREMMQDKFGGCGLGALDLIQDNSRVNVRSKNHGLIIHKPTQHKDYKPELQGMNNIYTTSDSNAWVSFTGLRKSRYGTHIGLWNTSLLYFRPTQETTVSCKVNDGDPQELYNGKSDTLQVVKTEGDINSIEWNLRGSKTIYYFAANEGRKGIVVDNFSIVSVPGTQHLKIPQETLQEFAKARDYDLIIFHYGLNIVDDKDQTGYRGFRKSYNKITEKFRKAWPEAAQLIVSVSDRSKRTENGEHTTMKGVEELVVAQREIAKKNKIAFWNLFSAMGGKGSIAKMEANGEAAKDFTHISFKGGKKLATMLFKAINNGLMNYNRHKDANADIDQRVNNIKNFTR
ncbi:MAG: hypothetical protein HUK06_07545 [Bacteroidaceae bacterium]|nr:hypothetical protein [Bacteroidaceae bacterium]